MDHQYIKECNIADRYVMGRLADQERDEFEQHFISCNSCVQAVEELQAVHDALTIVGRDAIVESEIWLVRGFRRLIPWLTPLQAVTLTATVVVLAAGPLYLFINQNRRLQAQRDDSLSLSQSLSEELREEREEALRKSTDRIHPDAGDKEVGGQSTSIPRYDRQLSRLREPIPDPPLTILGDAQRGVRNTTAPTAKVIDDPAAPAFVIEVDLQDEPDSRKYRATIQAESGNTVWKAKKVVSVRDGTLRILLPSGYLRPGNYLLVLQRVSSEPQVTDYHFELVRARRD